MPAQIRLKELQLDAALDSDLDQFDSEVENTLSALTGASEKQILEALEDEENSDSLYKAILLIYKAIKENKDEATIDILPAIAEEIPTTSINGGNLRMRIRAKTLYAAFKREGNLWIYTGLFGRNGVRKFGQPAAPLSQNMDDKTGGDQTRTITK